MAKVVSLPLKSEDFDCIGYWVAESREREFAEALVRELGVPKEAGGYVSANKFDDAGYSVGAPNTRQVRQFFREQGMDVKVIWADPGYDGIDVTVRSPFDQDILRRLRRATRLYPYKRTSDLWVRVDYVFPRELEVSAIFDKKSGFKGYTAHGEVLYKKDKLPGFIADLTEHKHPLSFGDDDILNEILG